MSPSVKDLAYNTNRQLDLYRTAETGRPLVICLHGGGFISGDKRDERCTQAAELLTRAGYNCASVAYSLAEPANRFARWPGNLLDVAEAVAFLHGQADRFGYDTGRFAFLGFSAGCCLANLYIQGGAGLFRHFGFKTSLFRPSALVGFYGPYDFTIRQRERRSDDDTINRLHSPRYWLRRNEGMPPPALHVHGTADEVVYFDQHEAIRGDCREKGYPFEGIVADGFGHSFAPRDVNAEGERIDLGADIVAFLDRYVAGNGA